jgi:hypothetical protein
LKGLGRGHLRRRRRAGTHIVHENCQSASA